MKRKMIYLIISLAALSLFGCGNKDKETNFIPTISPDEEVEQSEEEEVEETQEPAEDSTENESKEPVVVGKTTTKYVKLDKFNGILNIRSAPSTEGEVVGFLVHTEKVEVISIENGWASFLYQGELRYVSADFLVDRKPKYVTPPSPTPTLAPTPIPDPTEAPPEI